MKMRLGTVLVVLFTATSACSFVETAGEFRVPGDSASFRTDSAGIAIVYNRSPLRSGVASWSVEMHPAFTIGANERDPAHLLHEVVAATHLDNGLVLVANRTSPALRWYDSAGKLVRSAGRGGNGPGEFAVGSQGSLSLSKVWQIGDDTVAVLAPTMQVNRLMIFTPNGEYVRTIEVESIDVESSASGTQRLSNSSSTSPAAARPPRAPQIFARVGAGYAATVASIKRGSIGPVDATNLDSNMLVLISAEGRISSRIGWRNTSYTRSVAVHPRGSASATVIPLTPAFASSFAVAGGGGRMYYGFGDKYQIAQYDDSGVLRLLIRRDSRRKAVTVRDKEEFMRKARSEIPDGPLRNSMEAALNVHPFEDSLPVFQRFIVDTQGMLWVQEYTVDEFPTALWSVFDQAGQWIADVVLPASWTVAEIGLNYVLAVEKDTMDTESIRMYRLTRR